MRIRTLKPEWLSDEKLVNQSTTVRLLSLGLILLADDYGRGRAHPAYLTSQVWAYHRDQPVEEVEQALNELAEMNFVQLYQVNGQDYYAITNWAKHQRVDHPGKPLVPGPNDPEVTEARPWSTYFLRLGPKGPIKIGKTTNLTRRMAHFQITAPQKLILLRAVPVNLETLCHRKFRHLRTHGEWYRATPELLTFIKTGINEVIGSDADATSDSNISEPLMNSESSGIIPETPPEPFAPDLYPDLGPRPNGEETGVSSPSAYASRRRANGIPFDGPWPSVQAFVGLYNQVAPDECPAVEIVSEQRKKKIRASLKEFPTEEFWREVFQQIRKSRFLRGLKNGANHSHFVADLDWLLTKGKDGTENAVKVHDGKYIDSA